MNYTEIARKFNDDNGRAMTWHEAVQISRDNSEYFLSQSAALFAESVRLEERLKVVNKAVKIIDACFIEDAFAVDNDEYSLKNKIESLKTE